MPQIRVGSQRCVGIVKAARIKKREDSAHQAEGLKESQEYVPGLFTNKGQQKAYIHRYAAELEGEVPPVVMMFIYYECNAVLFPDFAEKHDYSADK